MAAALRSAAVLGLWGAAAIVIVGCGATAEGVPVALVSPERTDGRDELELAPEWRVTADEHRETLRCVEERSGVPTGQEVDDNLDYAYFVTCIFGLGYEDLYWPDESDAFIDQQRLLTREEEPSFWEQVLPFT